MKLTLKQKIIGLPLVAGILPVLVMLLLISVEKRAVVDKIECELDILARQGMERIALAMHETSQVSKDMIQIVLDRNLEQASAFFQQMGGISLSNDVVSWEAVNQVTGKKKTVLLPKVLIMGATWLGQDKDLNAVTSYIDQLKDRAGGNYAIFQRMNKQGDMIQVASTMPVSKNERAIGVYIPAVENGKPNPVISAILKKKSYEGLAYIVNGLHFSSFKAITDEEGKVIGMLYAGIPFKTPEVLHRAITAIEVGKTGYAWAIGGKHPEHRGHYVVSRGGQRDGENLWDAKDTDGHFFVRSIVDKALKLKKGEIGFERYPWRNPGESTERWKVSAFTYFEPWDWVIGVGAYEDDYYDARQRVEGTMNRLLWVMLISGLVVLAAVILLGLFVGSKIARPITQVAAIAREVARGDLSSAADSVKSLAGGESDDKGMVPEDETGHLLTAIKSMIENLNSLVGQVQRSGIQVTSSSTELAATAKEQEATMVTQVESTNKVLKSVGEISDVATGLVDTMQQVASMSNETAGFASSGQADLARMKGAMRSMEDASKSISGRLSAINEKAENITDMVTTITKVADQTNLLSLNAAIEAEKAGEYGRGFNVVAREIRRLADQTAVATLDIDQMVQEMQSAVSSGVMEMDKFIAEVKRSAEDVGKISAQLTKIIEQVQALSPSFEDVNVAVGHQSTNARKINSAMVNLSEELQQTTDSLRETYTAIEQLNEAAKGLQDEVSRFKVS